ncbi:Mitochondrial ATPase complex subunit atp10 [Rhizina undulata]
MAPPFRVLTRALISLPAPKCIFCQTASRALPGYVLSRQFASAPTPGEKQAKQLKPDDPLYDKVHDKKNDQPPRLSRPIGLERAPRVGENSGVDARSWRQRREDFVNYDKHIEKRQKLGDNEDSANEMFHKPYFRDFSRMSKQFKGKSWIAPPLLFRADKALFFANLQGRTLLSPEIRDTTTTLHGRVSIVSVFSSAWAENQTKTFLDSELSEVAVVKSGDAQIVNINVEENFIKAALIKLFLPSIKKTIPEGRHGKYFLVQKGLTEMLRHELGLWNSKVGYVYLIDTNCRIRWAGSGRADPEEKAAMIRGVEKLVAEHKTVEAAAKELEREDMEKKMKENESSLKGKP